MNSRKHIFSKRPWAALYLLLLIFLLVSGLIYAYLTDADRTDNIAVIGGNRIEIIEEFDPPKELTPGISFKKDVSITNIGLSDCFIRIKAVFTDNQMEDLCTVDYNHTYWVYDSEDGYWYYPLAISQGEKTESLFTTVTINSGANEDENAIISALIKDFDILIYAESYQSEGFSSYKAAWNHYHRNKPGENTFLSVFSSLRLQEQVPPAEKDEQQVTLPDQNENEGGQNNNLPDDENSDDSSDTGSDEPGSDNELSDDNLSEGNEGKDDVEKDSPSEEDKDAPSSDENTGEGQLPDENPDSTIDENIPDVNEDVNENDNETANI